MPSLADLLRNDPWGAPPQTPLAKTVTDVGFDPSLGFAGAVQTYLSRLKKMQGGLAQDMLDTAADPNAEGIQRAANLLGGLGLKIANVPMALMPSAQELRDRGYQAGASPELQAVGGALGDMVNIPEPASVGTLLAGLGKAAVGAKGLAGAAAMAGKSAAVAPLGKGLGSLLADATPAEQAALKARLEAEAAQPFKELNHTSNIERWMLDGKELSAPTMTENSVMQWLKAQGHKSGTITPQNINDVIASMEKHYGQVAPKVVANMRAMEGKQFSFTPDQTSYTTYQSNPDYWDPIQQADRAAQTGGQASSVSREQALNGLTAGTKAKDEITIRKNGGRYEVYSGDKYAGSAGVVDEHSSPFISVVNLEKEFRGKGVAKKLYSYIENDLGKKLIPSPLGISDDAALFWKKRLAKMSPDERARVLDESFKIGKSYGTKDAIINSFLGKLKD